MPGDILIFHMRKAFLDMKRKMMYESVTFFLAFEMSCNGL